MGGFWNSVFVSLNCVSVRVRVCVCEFEEFGACYCSHIQKRNRKLIDTHSLSLSKQTHTHTHTHTHNLKFKRILSHLFVVDWNRLERFSQKIFFFQMNEKLNQISLPSLFEVCFLSNRLWAHWNSALLLNLRAVHPCQPASFTTLLHQLKNSEIKFERRSEFKIREGGLSFLMLWHPFKIEIRAALKSD